jgi:hypothetical protein
MKIKYYIDGIEQNFVNRVVNTKTFYFASAAMLGVVADAVNKALETGVYLIAWKQVLATAVFSGVAVAIRDAKAKAELASNANNQSVPSVEAKEVTK